MTLTLVGATTFRSFRNVWMLEELGVQYEHILARPKDEHAKAGNPFGKVPSLIDETGDQRFVSHHWRANVSADDEFRDAQVIVWVIA